MKESLKTAVEYALAGEWDASHKIAQEFSDTMANWIHAVLHKIEGDASNSRYWYARSNGHSYEDFASSQEELKEILRRLESA
ncbi:MAG: hypothetical protein ACKVN9_06315 [Methylophilaceae bacterium]